jgi:multiple sugar transport system substrate-binding protein
MNQKLLLRVSHIGCVLVLALAFLVPSQLTFAEESQELIVMCHRVHKDVFTGVAGAKINLTDDLLETEGIKVRWETLPWPYQELVYREASLAHTDVGMMYLNNLWVTPQMVRLLTPLNEFLESDPIENFDKLPKGMLDAMTINGKIYGIPMRATPQVLFYNKKILAEYGFMEAPKTFEEVLEIARKVSGSRADGRRVYGIRFQPDSIIDWARAFGGDFISKDYEMEFTKAPMVRAVEEAQKLYQAGAIPENFMNMPADEFLTLLMTGQQAMAIRGAPYYSILTDPEQSLVAEDIGVTTTPASKDVSFDASPVTIAFWAMTIPKAAENKETSWRFIRYCSSDEVALTMALNGNVPTKLSVLENEKYSEGVPYASLTIKALDVSYPQSPAFDELPKVMDIFREQVILAVVGKKSPQQAMDDAAKMIKPLLPTNQ